MTEILKRKDDHVLVVTGNHFAVECPFGPDRHGKACSYLDGCSVCTAAYDQDVDTVHAVLGEEIDLELNDWVNGTFFVLTREGKYDDDMTNAVEETKHPRRPRLDIPAHEECLDHGLDTRVWEGELHHQTGMCFVADDVALYDDDLVTMAFEDSEFDLADGRWIIHYVSLGEDGLEITIEGKQT